VQAFLLLDASFQADAIIGPKTIKSIKDFKGKQVAYEAGSTSELSCS
jgi:NitT/TauT family transport system substrate-binding protein